jgi:serine/threonine protein kinase
VLSYLSVGVLDCFATVLGCRCRACAIGIELYQYYWPLPDTSDRCRYLHHIGRVHRDLKPDNCSINHAMRAKVGNFGTSRATSMALIDQSAAGSWVTRARAWSGSSASSFLSTEPIAKTCMDGPGSWRWVAPEVLSQKRRSLCETSAAIDVYRSVHPDPV